MKYTDRFFDSVCDANPIYDAVHYWLSKRYNINFCIPSYSIRVSSGPYSVDIRNQDYKLMIGTWPSIMYKINRPGLIKFLITLAIIGACNCFIGYHIEPAALRVPSAFFVAACIMSGIIIGIVAESVFVEIPSTIALDVREPEFFNLLEECLRKRKIKPDLRKNKHDA